MSGDEFRPYRGTMRCCECGAVLEVIEGEKVEPCWDCIKAAKEAERMKHSPYKEALEEKAAKIAESVAEMRAESATTLE